MNEENKESEAQEETLVEEVQEAAPVGAVPERKIQEEDAPVVEAQEAAPVEEVQEATPAEEVQEPAPAEEAPKPAMDAVADGAKDLTEKVASFSTEAKESMSADYKEGGAGALVKNKYFWIMLGIIIVVLILFGVFD